jgi:hypothetical protein
VTDLNKPVPSDPAPDPAPTPGSAEWSKDIKAYYDQVANEPVPEAFTRLMADLAKSIRK